jgi:hypothetical protein
MARQERYEQKESDGSGQLEAYVRCLHEIAPSLCAFCQELDTKDVDELTSTAMASRGYDSSKPNFEWADVTRAARPGGRLHKTEA